MRIRKNIAIRVFNSVLLLATTLSLAFPTRIRAQCTRPSSNQTSGNAEQCSFEHQLVTKSESYHVHIDISCSSGGWRTSTGDSGDISMSAQGDCGYASSGGPICPYDIFGPTDRGVLNGSRRVEMDGYTNYYNASGDFCYPAGHQTNGLDLTDEDCQSAFCCNLGSECISNGEWYADSCTCVFSPVLLDLDGNGFDLTDVQNGVRFDLDRNGTAERIAWTSGRGKDAFLVLDRNGNGRVDDGSELFGSSTDQPRSPSPSGFAALAVFDSNGDGVITSDDAVFENLRLWIDANHDSVSQANELYRLSEFGITGISLDFKLARRHDRRGNTFRYRAAVTTTKDSRVGPFAWDVFLKSLP